MLEVRIRAAKPEDANDEDVRSLLSAATSSSRVADLVTTAAAHGVCLLAFSEDALLGSVCVLPSDQPGAWVLRAIAVDADQRLGGIGRRLVQEAIARSGAQIVTAETDSDAVDFYSRLGFSVTSLGEKYPGVERFVCTWRISSTMTDHQDQHRLIPIIDQQP